MQKLLLALFTLLFAQGILANPVVVLETTKGNITIELFEKEAPATVQNFLAYVDEGFYNGTIFHRVIPDFVVQGGGFNKNLSKKETKAPIQNEAKAALKNLRGTISMARLSAPHSATSQFFINLRDNPALDYKPHNMGYTVFGKIDDTNMMPVDQISYVETGTTGMHQNVPVEPIEIIRAYRLKVEGSPAAASDSPSPAPAAAQ